MSTVIEQHSDTLTQKVILSLLTDVENYFINSQQVLKKSQRRVRSVSVEALQNVLKYQSNKSSFSYSLSDNSISFVIQTVNSISNHQKKSLEDKLNKINDLGLSKLKAMQIKALNTETLSENGGAGFGLIDIARKSDKKLAFEFVALDQENTQFHLTITIRK